MKTKAFFNKILWVFVALLLSLLCVFQGVFVKTAYAEETAVTYTDVMTDLQKDENFNPNDYPVVADNNTLSVITVAESENLQLFIYVYQPTYGYATIVASSINISTAINNKLNFVNYELTLLSQVGVFQKYVVNDFVVNGDSIRYYEISSILSPSTSSNDLSKDSSSNDSSSSSSNDSSSSSGFAGGGFGGGGGGARSINKNTVNELSHKVGKIFTFEDIDGRTVLSVSDVETISITSKYVGYCRYEGAFNGFAGIYDYYDSHYVAFSTDKKIDKLYEADVYYQYQEYEYNRTNGILLRNKFSTPEDKYAYLTDTDKGNYTADNLFWKTEYNWYRISTVEDFIATENRTYMYSAGILNVSERNSLTDECLEDLKDKEWVLRFTETHYREDITTSYIKRNYAVISNVSVLRLLFETDGVPYNLGVVDNKQTGSSEPSNSTTIIIEPNYNWLAEVLAWIVGLGLLVGLVIVLFNCCPWVISLIGKGIAVGFKWLIKAILFVLCFPFNLIGLIFKKRKQKNR